MGNANNGFFKQPFLKLLVYHWSDGVVRAVIGWYDLKISYWLEKKVVGLTEFVTNIMQVLPVCLQYTPTGQIDTLLR
jgi:hypothetical protein